MSLKNINFQLEYRTMKQNIVKEFYEPALSEARCYKRAVGFFTSSALLELSRGLQGLIENGGTVRIVASPKLRKEDVEAIQYGYEKREHIITNALLRELKAPETPFQKKRLNLLANYIMDGKLDIKIAYIHTGDSIGIFHEKLGLIEDGDHTIAFTGSMNESETAYYHNYESIDVYCDWRSEESYERVRKKKEAFDAIWWNDEEGIEVLEFPLAVQKKLETYRIEPISEKLETEDFLSEEAAKECLEGVPFIPADFEIRDYQSQAVQKWKESGYCGIYDMATGTGKTYTALLSVVKLYQDMKGKLAVIIVCPYQHLVEQWIEDLKYFHMNPLVGYSQSVHKKLYKKALKDYVFGYQLGTVEFFCFICTNATFSSKAVQEELRKLHENVLLLIDEVHNAGATSVRNCLSEHYTYRLGLSATVDRHGDEEGTKAIYDYFKTVCIHYDLETAIREHMLTPYRYYPVVVYLTERELEDYRELSRQIGKYVTKDRRGKVKLSETGKRLAIKRARIVAAAWEKEDALAKIIEEKSYQSDTHMLVYCGAASVQEESSVYGVDPEEMRQIDRITRKLGIDLDMNVAQFTSHENKKERQNRIREFTDGDIQALIAMKCLDEGVNIPKIKTAFVLASTTNPKEYIQRRGRVLRKAKGKDEAVIYDFITLPRPVEDTYEMTEEELSYDRSLVKNELARMEEFKRLAKNPYDSDFLIEELREAYNLYEAEMFAKFQDSNEL